MPPFAVIIPAAGQSTRFGGTGSKLLEMLAGRPVVAHAVGAFLRRDDVSSIVVPTQDEQAISEALGDAASRLDPRIRFCPGGRSRAHSVWNGLKALDDSVEWVAIHDAARPLVSQELINRTLAAAVEHGSAVPAMPVQLTIKQASGPLPPLPSLPRRIDRTVPRESLWAVQTPQIMRRDALAAAISNCALPLETITDDVQFLELAGGEVWLVAGEERNIKITTAMDLRVAAMWMEEIA
jgi:2-C-methyl-D-erythritol 4-phosphate cytidylyltransferase